MELVKRLFDYQIDDRIKSRNLEVAKDFQFYFSRLKKFRLGYITGSSGSGKTYLLKELSKYKEISLSNISDKDEKSIIERLGSNTEKAIERLNMAGLSSVPLWFQSFSQLSAGEQARFIVAKELSSDSIIDEFTSNLDRLTARSLSHCVQKYIRRNDCSNVIVAGCYKDIIPWLKPDWIYHTDEMRFETTTANEINDVPWLVEIRKDKEEAHPLEERKLILVECERKRWKNYSRHHYLSSDLANNAACWEAFVRMDGFVGINTIF